MRYLVGLAEADWLSQWGYPPSRRSIKATAI
jgi:hypothetical protein